MGLKVLRQLILLSCSNEWYDALSLTLFETSPMSEGTRKKPTKNKECWKKVHSFSLHFGICNLVIKHTRSTRIFIFNYYLSLYTSFEMRLCCKNIYAETSKVAREIFQKGVHILSRRFPFLHNFKCFQKNDWKWGAASVREASLIRCITVIGHQWRMEVKSCCW